MTPIPQEPTVTRRNTRRRRSPKQTDNAHRAPLPRTAPKRRPRPKEQTR